MIRTGARGAGLLAPLAVLATIAMLAAGCGSFSRDLEPGTYRAVLEIPGGELPFGLDVAKEESGIVLYLVNGEDRVRIGPATAADGRLRAALPGDGNTLTAAIRGGELTGEVSLPGDDGKGLLLPFRASLGETWRFFDEPSTDNADVAGRWSVSFTTDQGEQRTGVADLSQSFEVVTATFRTPSGAPGLLAGELQGDDLLLSRFDGASAWLCKATVDPEGDLVGECWSAESGRQTLRAERDPDAAP